MDKLKRVMAMAGVILTAGIWIATFLTAVLGGSKELLTALLVLSVVVPVLIYAILLVARIVSVRPGFLLRKKALIRRELRIRDSDRTGKSCIRL